MTSTDDRREPSDDPRDSGDQAQDLRFAMEQEAIAAALAGHPRGDDHDEADGGATIADLEGEDPLAGPGEGDSSDDPLYGGGDVTGQEPPGRSAHDLADDLGT